MKIAYVNFATYPDDIRPDVLEICHHLLALGVEVSLIGLDGPKMRTPAGLEQIKLYTPQSTNYQSHQYESGKADVLSFVRFAQSVIESNTFDVVLVLNFPGCFLLPQFARRNTAANWVYDVRSGGIHRGLRGKLGDLSVYFQMNWFDCTIFQNEKVRERLAPISGKRIVLIPLGVDTNRFRPADGAALREQLQIAPEELVYLYAGALHPTRQLDRVLHAFKKILAENSKCRLVLIGGGSAHDSLVQLARDLQITEQVLFTGWVPYDQVPQYLAIADIALSFVPITPEYDAQPVTKALEYLSCGLPVIATNTYGHRLCIRNGDNALLCNDDVIGLAGAMSQLAVNKLLRCKLAEAARPSVQPFEWRSIVRKQLLPALQALVSEQC